MKTSAGYIASSRPAPATGDPVSKNKTKSKTKDEKKINLALKLGTRANVQDLRG